jgi:phosphatidylglycerophosphatase A
MLPKENFTMSTLTFLKRPVALAATFLVLATASGCAKNADGTLAKDDKGNYIIDEKAKSALVGAAVGCAVGAAADVGCGKGALVGAVAGFLIGWYFESQKVANAQEVNKQYAANKKGTPPPPKDVVPAAFTAQVTPGKQEANGEREVKVSSSTDMIGYGDKVPDVQQKYTILDEQNKVVETKTEKLAVVDGAGRYTTHSKFKLPASAKGKTYTVQTALLSNGKTFKENTYKVAIGDDGTVVQLALR